jgi:FkbH-like protein
MNEQKEIKCIVWDLDNTLWDGILLEGDELKLKPEIGHVIEKLDQRGILHSIASKGVYEDAIFKLKEFHLDKFFLYPEISWNAKSQSITKIQNNLNIGMDTLMFIDDQPFERDEVKSRHPEVTCIEATEYLNLLPHPRLNPKFVTKDSGKRRLMYLENQRRKTAENDFKGPRKDFLASLDIHFLISEAKDDDLKRAEELTVRTNQLNATGKTYSYDELEIYLRSTNHKLIICEMHDKYGSYGRIGLALVENSRNCLHVKLLLMSCRVMSYGVGTILLLHIMKQAQKCRKKLRADFKHTGRNRVMYVTFKFAGFKEIMEDEFGVKILENDLSSIQEFPPYVNVKLE